MRSRCAAMAFIYLTATLDMLAFGLMIPVLPFLDPDFTSGDTARAAEVSGLFGTIFAATQFLLGALSDRIGRRPVIVLSNLGLGLDYVLMALAPNLSWLFVGRLVAGVTSSSFSTASAYGWDQATVGFTLVGVGLCGIAVSAGLVGPIVGALGERRTLLLGLLFGVLGFSLQAWAPIGAFFWAGVPLIALWGLYHPALQGRMVGQVGPSAQGRLQGAIQSLRSLTGLATPLLYTQTFAGEAWLTDLPPVAPHRRARRRSFRAMGASASQG